MPKLVVFVEERLLVRGSRLEVVNALHVGDIRTKARVGQRPVLADGLRLQVRGEIGERIGAGIVVVLIAPHESAEGKHGVGADAGASTRARC